jgi:peptidoglycan LD-endopeptidase LytH
LNVTNAFARPRAIQLRPSRAPKPRGRRRAWKFLARLAFAGAAFGFVALGGADSALRSGANSVLAYLNHSVASVSQETATAHAAPSSVAMTWTIDVDADGIADFSNPTHGAMRGVDAFGSGRFGAIRDAGKRRHHGVDYVATPGAAVVAPLSGKVTRIGFAYSGPEGLQYVEIVNPETHLTARVLYLAPTVAEGDLVSAGDAIGIAQDLTGRYPGITNHVHVEMRDAQRRWLDASQQLPSAPVLQAQARANRAA